MSAKTFHIIDSCGAVHEILMENTAMRYYITFRDGVRESFIEECLSFEAAIRVYCRKMRVTLADPEMTSSNGGPAVSAVNDGARNGKGKRELSPADCLTMLEDLHDLFRKEMITRSELDSMRTRIIAYFSRKF